MIPYLREVPLHLITAVHSGDMQVYGSIIRSMDTGKIVGHLQETRAVHEMVSSSVGSALLGPIGPMVDIGLKVVTIYQNKQIKAAINVLKNLQIANLAVGVAGIGVSVAGFAVIAHKINALDKKIDMQGELLKNIASGIEKLEQRQVRSDYSKLLTLAQQMDEAWSLNNPENQWQDVAREAHILTNDFAAQFDDIINSADGGIGVLAARPLFNACVMANRTRISARMAAGDDVAARFAAQEGANMLIKMGEHFNVLKFLQPQIESNLNENSLWTTELDAAKDELTQHIAPIRNSQMAAASLCETLDTLDKRNIKGRQWLESALKEEVPLLFLPSE